MTYCTSDQLKGFILSNSLEGVQWICYLYRDATQFTNTEINILLLNTTTLIIVSSINNMIEKRTRFTNRNEAKQFLYNIDGPGFLLAEISAIVVE